MLSKGAYGCVFKPSLLCEGEKVAPENTVSKFMSLETVSNEMLIKSILKRIDPEQNYFLYPLSICKPSRRYKKSLRLPTNAITKCTIPIEDDEARLLRFKDGGTSLQDLVIQPSQYKDFFSGLLSLFEGLTLLHNNTVRSVYHLDIKTDNIVCDDEMRCRFIDFGMSDTLARQSLIIATSANGSIYPFELQFLNGFTFKGKSIGEKSQVVDAFLDDFREDRYYFPADMIIPFGESKFKKKYKLANNLLEYYIALEEKIHDDYPKNGPKLTHFLYSTTDVFTLGKVLSFLYGRHMGQFLQYSDDHQDGHLFFLDSQGRRKQFMKGQQYEGLVNELVDPEQIAWFKEVYDKISFPFYKLILNMVTLEPYKRFTAEKAANAYKAIIPSIEELLTEENINKYMAFMAPYLPYGEVKLNVALTPASKRIYRKGARSMSLNKTRKRSLGRNNVTRIKTAPVNTNSRKYKYYGHYKVPL